MDSDVKLFLKTQLTDIIKNQSNYNLTEGWPSLQDIEILCKKAAGFFIYASTVIKFVTSQHHPPDKRLALIISLPQDTSHEGRSGVDLLYTQVLGQAFSDVDQEFLSHFKSVVGMVVLISNPLSIISLSHLGNCGTPSRMYSTLCTLHSLLLVPDSMEDPVHIFHKSFPDFLMDPERCTDHRFFIDPLVYHTEIMLSCLRVMNERLKKDICELGDCASLSDVKDLSTQRKAYIWDVLGYACHFWTHHLIGAATSSPGIENVYKAIDKFFTTNLLLWIEVLSLMGILDVGIHALNNIQQWYTLVSYICSTHSVTLCSCLFREEFPANG